MPGRGQRGSLGGLPTPLVVLCAGGMPSPWAFASNTLLLLLALHKRQLDLGFFVLFCFVCIFLPIICSNCIGMQIFLAP